MSGRQSQQQQGDQSGGLIPAGMNVIAFEGFAGLNTNASRVGIKDEEMYICDGFMPIGESWLRTLYGIGAAIFDASGQGLASIAYFDFVNLGAVPWCIVFLADGGVWAVNVNSLVASAILPPGTILNPSVQNTGVSQWASTYVLIVSKQPNGYFIWNGSAVSTAGGLSPVTTISVGGTGYSAPTIVATGGSGSGATFSATLVGGIITAISLTSPGTGYLATDTSPLTLTITDPTGDGTAAATVDIMPFGISGTAVATYQGRVWILNGVNLIWSAPGSVDDFAASDGGGVAPSSDSFLRVEYTELVNTNGFLYLIGDSSVSYISGIATTVSGATTTTTFSLQNADPQTGTPYPGSVSLLGQDIIFGNSSGVHAVYGGRVAKVSDALDGIYSTVPGFGGFSPSSANAILFGKRVWMVLVPIVDQRTGQQVNKLLMWDRKRWWTSDQDIALTYITTQEINSVLTAYGTDGNQIVPLFAVPSTGFTKTAQSKLFAKPPYMLGKVASRLWGLAQYYSLESPDIEVGIDNENGIAPQTVAVGPSVMTWTNNAGQPIAWLNSSGNPITWFAEGVGIVAFPPTAVAQQGVLLGMTLSTNCADMALLSVAIGTEPYQYRG